MYVNSVLRNELPVIEVLLAIVLGLLITRSYRVNKQLHSSGQIRALDYDISAGIVMPFVYLDCYYLFPATSVPHSANNECPL